MATPDFPLTFQFPFQVAERDRAVRALNGHLYNASVSWAATLVFFAIAVGAVAGVQRYNFGLAWDDAVVSGLLYVGVLYWVQRVFGVVNRIRLRRATGDAERDGEMVELRLDDAALCWSVDGTQLRLPWSSVDVVLETKTAFVFSQSGLAVYLPFAVIAQHIERERLREQISDRILAAARGV